MTELKKAEKKLSSLYRKYRSKRGCITESVHKELLIRAYELIRPFHPYTDNILGNYFDVMLHHCYCPDLKGDYEKGMGRHYYCSVNASGKKLPTVHGYYKNGAGKFAKSARTMFEEDYTMALTMYNAGFYEQSAAYLGRAVHMLSDMCCLPHASKWTYFSSKGKLHKAYENLASAVYPDFVPKQQITDETLKIFSHHKSFGPALNKIVEREAKEVELLKSEPLKELKLRLLATERAVAALLYRFCNDIALPPEAAHYLEQGMVCKPFKDTPKLTLRITEKGILFTRNAKAVQIKTEKNRTAKLFRVAHRSDGEYSLSPVYDSHEGRVISSSKTGLFHFDPKKSDIFFKF